MNKKFFLDGINKTLPLMLGVMPFGLAYGVMGSQSGMTVIEITLMSLVVFAGAAQFMAVSMISQNIGFAFIVFSTLLINLRHFLMALSLAPYLNKVKAGWLYGLAFGMTDESYATAINHYQESKTGEGNPYFMLGSCVGMYVFWVVSSVIGALLGQSISDPLSWGLDFAMTATFLSILIPQIVSLRVFIVVLVSGVCATVALLYIPGKWYIIIAATTAVTAGTIMEMIDERRIVKCE